MEANESREDAEVTTLSGYAKRFEKLYRIGEVAVQVETIVTTEDNWSRRPERLDLSWEIQPHTAPLVVAMRAIV